MNDLRRELAPITEAAWAEIEDAARDTLKTCLAGRKLVDFEGPLGWKHSAVTSGRTRRVQDPHERVEARLRLVQPLMELRVPFRLSRDELDAVDRGAPDPKLDALEDAARRLAAAEDGLIFDGNEEACVRGMASGSDHEPLTLTTDYSAYPNVVSDALERLRIDGVGGPYAIALGPRCYTGLARTTGPGGYPVIQHVKRLLQDGPVVWAPALDGALVLSLRGGDFQVVVGRDASIGYLRHDEGSVELYLEESLTFRNISPEAAVPLRYQG